MARTTPAGGGSRSAHGAGGRGVGEVLKAVAAFLALAALVFGVPVSLAYFIGWPLPSSAPSLDMLQREIGTDAFLKVLAALVWVAWAQFTACVLVEARAAVSGVGIPRRVPGAGPSQLLARQLVGALLLFGSVAAGLAPGLGQLGPETTPPPVSSVVAEASQFPDQRAELPPGIIHAEPAMAVPDQEPAQEEVAEQATKYYRIQPPEGRHHDTLWGISERHLDDGLRYKEVFQLNKDRVQPDGSRLTEASLIRPGWILEMPADAHGGELVEMPNEAEQLTPVEAGELREYQGTGDTQWADHTPPQEQEAHPEAAEPAPDRADGGTLPSSDAHPDGSAGADDPDSADDADGSDRDSGSRVDVRESDAEAGPAGQEARQTSGSFGLPDALMAAPLLAAGLLVALGRTRRNALWQSAAGVLERGVSDELAPRSGVGTDARDALLVGADPAAVTFLDQALRQLSAALDADGRILPDVYAAWLGQTDLRLQLAAPAGRPPAPWRQGQGETYWTLTVEDLPEGQPEAEAPYPGLVSLGLRDDIRLLLNLEAIPGLVSVTGAAPDREAVLASIAAELATSGWSDRMTVTLVGFGADLTALAPTRVRHLEDITGLLEVMETETTLRHGALRHTGQDSILTGRTGPARQQQWAPHLVVVGSTPTEEEADRLAGLASVAGPLGIGYVVASDRPGLPGLAWEFDVSAEGRLTESAMGLELAAQLLPAEERAAVVRLFTELVAGSEGAGMGRTDGPAFTVDLTAQGRPEVYAQILGGYEITGLPEPEAGRAGQLREALALLLLHRSGVHPRVLASALWPRGVPDDVRDTFLARLGDWLGADESGAPRLVTGEDGRMALSGRIVSDWDVLRTLHHQAGGPGTPTHERKRQLTDALALAAGPLLEGNRTEGRYGWLDHEIVDAQYPLLVADIALGLSAVQLEAGEGEQGYTTVRSALAAAPADERLWNELLRTAQATGKPEWLTGAADWLVAHHQQMYGLDRTLPAQTEALLDELLPGWREGERS